MKRLSAWLLRVPDNDGPLYWSALAGILIAAFPFYVAAGMDLASGLGRLADVLIFSSLLLLAFQIGSCLIGCGLLLIRLKAPRIFIGGTVTVFCSLLLILHEGKINWWGAGAIAVITLLLGFMLGSSVYSVIQGSRRSRRLIWQSGYAFIALLLFVGSWLWLLFDFPFRDPDYLREVSPVTSVRTLPVQNPGQPGDYTYQTFTYGSGTDRARKMFNEAVAVVTPTVDGSAIIKDWDWSRKWLWGYNVDRLPLNGMVWLPEGTGPFPLVLIVHGNHSMADYSDTGYAYLGEQLASRGMIAVSVDENFINHSTWEGGLDTLSENMTIRAWLLLQHLMAIEKLNAESGNSFYGKVDMDRIALIGHSRGGQAAVLAADFNHFFAADSYKNYRVDHEFNIETVIAIAPTDMLVYERNVKVNDINYLLLQGLGDADVNTFSGDRMYNRIAFTDQSYKFKSSLYIKGANHGQFNTGWNRRDIGLPTQLFLNKKDLLDGDDQRMIAKVYISAFLERWLHGDDRYEPMFQDYRYALPWLPETHYVSRYMNASFVRLTDAEEDGSKESASHGAKITVTGMEKWSEEDLKNRRKLSQHNKIIRLAWKRSGAEYVIDLGRHNAAGSLYHLNERSMFSFSLGSFSDDNVSPIRMEIEFVDGKGSSASISLDRYVPVPEPIYTRYLKLSWLERTVRKGGLAATSEPLLQSYAIPISDWMLDNTRFELADIRQIRFRMKEPASGDIMLDEVGFQQSG